MRNLSLAAVALVAVAAHSPALNAPFLWDDHALIKENPVVNGARPLADAARTLFWEGVDRPHLSRYYRPVVVASLGIDRRLWGARPAGFHATNLVLHAIVSVLVLLVVRRAVSSERAALIAAALFAAMPRLTESVAWISGRTDLLATLFLLAALLAHARGRPVLVGASVLLAMLCKESALVAPALLVAWDMTRTDRPSARAVALRTAPALGGIAAALALRWLVAGELLPSGAPADLGARAVLMLRTAGLYASMILTPTNATARIGEWSVELDAWVVAGGVAMLFVAAWALWSWRRDRVVFLGLAWLALALAPVLNFAPVPTLAPAADRFLYLPAAGLALLAARGLERWEQRAPAWATAMGAAALAVFAVSTARRSTVYQTSTGYWTDAAARAPAGDAAVWHNLGQVHSTAGRHPEALESYLEALRRVKGRWVERTFECELNADIALAYAALGEQARALGGLDALEDRCAAVRGFQQARAAIRVPEARP